MVSIPTMDLTSRDEIVLGVDRGAQVTGVACAALVLPWVAVVLRLYVRIGIQRFVGTEDWLTLASMVCVGVHRMICKL